MSISVGAGKVTNDICVDYARTVARSPASAAIYPESDCTLPARGDFGGFAKLSDFGGDRLRERVLK